MTTVERGGDKRENCSDQDESGHHSVRGNSSDGNTRLIYRSSGQDSTPVHTVILYPCNQCYYQATTKQYLQIHIQSVHEGIKYILISVIIKPLLRLIFRDIFSQNMKVSSILGSVLDQI